MIIRMTKPKKLNFNWNYVRPWIMYSCEFVNDEYFAFFTMMGLPIQEKYVSPFIQVFFFNGSIKLCCFLNFCTFLFRVILFLYIFSILYFTFYVYSGFQLRITLFQLIFSQWVPPGSQLSLCAVQVKIWVQVFSNRKFIYFITHGFAVYGFDKYKIICFTFWSLALIPDTPYSFDHNK